MEKLQRICPQYFKSFQTLVGDENGAGTIWLATLAMGPSHEEMVKVKHKVVAVDDESRTLNVSMIDRDLLRKYPR
ncbi:hypothetical protein C5167_030543 [Papaver somniferum]|nr:hypothetical protein C5167_030543 [Papaver somniferum]